MEDNSVGLEGRGSKRVEINDTSPGFRGALLVTSNEYNTANQLVTTRTYSLEQPVLRSLGEGGSSNSSPLTYTLAAFGSDPSV